MLDPMQEDVPVEVTAVVVEEESQRDDSNDQLATLIRGKFEEARDYRRNVENERWLPGEDAYNGIYVDELRKESGRQPPYMNMTRREVTSAHIKINGMLFQNNKIPFKIIPARKPRFIPADIHQMAEGMPMMTDKERSQYIKELSQHLLIHQILTDRARNMENRIRDILDQSHFTVEIAKAIHEMCLHGTGCLKSPVLIHRNYPVFSGRFSGYLESIESSVEQDLLPTAKFVTIFNLYPSPEATSPEDATYIIERTQLSSVQARQLLTEENGYDPKAIAEVLEHKYTIGGYELSRPINPHQESYQEEEKEYELLEFWGGLDKDDLEGYLELGDLGELDVASVCITVLGNRVIKAVINPYDGMLPYHFAYWHDNTHSIWGDGIYSSIRDIQSLINFTMSMYVEAKEMSSVPMVGVDTSQLAADENAADLYPGKIWQFAPGADISSAFRPVLIPDVSNGLMELMQFLQREANLSSGQSPIGMGQTAPYQTKTATGMSILNSNQQKQTASVIQSISNMMRGALTGIYRWILVDTDDPDLHCDAEALCTGYERYIAEEVHNQQLMQFMQVLQQLPQLSEQIRIDRLAKPLLDAFNLEPEDLLKSEEEVQQGKQQQMQQLQMQMQMEAQKKLQEGQIEEQLTRLKAALDERTSIGKQRRDLEIQRVLKQMDMGMNPQPSDFSDLSILLKEELRKLDQQQQQQQLEKQQYEQERQLLAQELMNEQRQAAQRPTVPPDTRRTAGVQRSETMATPGGNASEPVGVGVGENSVPGFV